MTKRLAWKAADNEVLCGAGRRDLTIEAFRERTLGPLSRMVTAMCDWGPGRGHGRVGDVRFLILDFTARAGLAFYVQILSEPGEPVLAEAASGAWQNRRCRAYMTPARRAIMRRLGYRVGGQARNFRKHWHVPDRAAARSLAEELLRLLHEVYGYRGRQPLLVTRASDARSEPTQAFLGVGVDDVRKMTAAAGVSVRAMEVPAGATRATRKEVARMLTVDAPFPFMITLCGTSAHAAHLFEGVRFQTAVDGTGHVADSRIVAAAAGSPFVRLYRDGDGDVVLSWELVLVGASEQHYRLGLQRWVESCAQAIRSLQAERAERPARTRLRTAKPAPAAVDRGDSVGP